MSLALLLGLGLTVGLPLTLLAAAIAYSAWVSARMPEADARWEPDEDDEDALPPAAFRVPGLPGAADPTLVELRHTVDDLRGQLARQRSQLTDLLSARERAREDLAPAPAPAPLPTLSALPPMPTAPLVTPQVAVEDMDDVSQAVRQLLAEGNSDRAIARRLHISLEEVRLLSRRTERAS